VSITVLGHAVGEQAPDRVEWTLIVREVDADPRAAFDRCAGRLNALAGALSMAEVTTGAVAVAAQYEERKPTGRHEAHAALTAVAALALGGEVAAAAIDAGADELQGPRVRFPDADELYDALHAEAVQIARRRAERIAAAADRQLGRVVSVTDRRATEYDEDFVGEPMSRRSDGSERPATIPRPRRLVAAVVVVFELV
jgi:uncharacterized protein YggE